MTAGDEASRARHPTGQWWPRPASLLSRVVADLAAEGHPFPRFAGVVLAVRGRSGLDQATFSRFIGVPLGLLRGLESGVLHPGQAPPALAELVSAFDDCGPVTTARDASDRSAALRSLGRAPPARTNMMDLRPRQRR